MTEAKPLQRFIDAQQRAYPLALSEVRNGRKEGHWMWYIFPQIQGLGFSETSRFYAIQDLREAEAYLKHPILGSRLVEICTELLELEGNDATRIFGSPDDLKLKSSMTLFSAVPDSHSVFQMVLDKFFAGLKDPATLRIIASGG